MRCILSLALCLFLACASGPHVYADDAAPTGIPKSARAHCRGESQTLADEYRQNGLAEKYRVDAANPLVLACLDGMLRADCAMEMLRTAEALEKAQRDTAAFFFKFPGGWDRDEVEDSSEALKESVCQSLPIGLQALAIHMFHQIRFANGGRIPWGSRGWATPGSTRCFDSCPAK